MLGLSIPTLFTRIITLVIAFTVHEFAHAWTADKLGDDTPRAHGRLTLNPLAHLDVMGSLLLLVAGFGWAKPVPINPYALYRRTPAGVMWVSLAGPFSNFLMAVLAAIPIRMGLVSFSFDSGKFLPTPFEFLWQFIAINLLLMLFNLLPLAPLDGDKIANYFFPPTWVRFFDQIRPYGPIILLSLLMIGPYFNIDIIAWIVSPVLSRLMGVLLGVG